MLLPNHVLKILRAQAISQRLELRIGVGGGVQNTGACDNNLGWAALFRELYYGGYLKLQLIKMEVFQTDSFQLAP